MRATLVAFFVALLGVVILAAESDLVVKSTYRPLECSLLAASGDKVYVHYLAKLRSTGEVFDSSYERDEPLSFVIGDGEMLTGFEQGVTGMCPGEKRMITIPPSLGYGNEQIGAIPPGSILVFTVHMINVERVPFTAIFWNYLKALVRVGLPVFLFTLGMWALIRKYSNERDYKKPTMNQPRNPNSNTQKKREARMKAPLGPLE